jgi:hypothetical protein
VDITASPESWVESGHDLNGDGSDEVLFVGPMVESEDREVYILNFLTQNPEYVTVDLPTQHYALGDVTGDGLTDLLQMFQTGNLQAFTFSDAGYMQRNMATFSEPSAFAVADHNGDASVDLLLAGPESWAWRWGQVSVDGRWSALAAPFQTLGVNRYDGFVPIGTGSDVEFARVYAGSNMTVFTRYSLEPGTSQSPVESGWTVMTYEERDFLDGVVCDDIAWVLLEGKLVRLNLQGGSPSVTGTLELAGERVACGAGPENSRAALLVDGEVLLLDNALNVKGTELAEGAYDVAIGRSGGTGVIETCSTEACTIDAWFVDGPEADSVWVIGANALTITDGAERTFEYAISANIRVADADGDGDADVLLHQPDGVLGMLRGLEAPIELWTASPTWEDFVWAADVDGDELPELWVVDEVGDLGWIQSVD